MAFFYAHPAGTKWKDGRVDLAVSPMISSNRGILQARIQKLELLGESQLLSWAR